MTMKQCKHLDYDGEYVHCELKTAAPHFPKVRYWERSHLIYEGAPKNVQFCKLRGRINEIFACYNVGEMSCHEPLDEENNDV